MKIDLKTGLLLAALLLTGCSSSAGTRDDGRTSSAPAGTPAENRAAHGVAAESHPDDNSAPATARLQSRPSVSEPAGSTARPASTTTAKAYFAGGCFWCMESSLEQVPGVIEVISGYTGGQKVNPTYHEVGSGSTGHAESVEVLYDPKKITYARLLEAFWHNVDPFAHDRQFCDAGTQYRSAIFYQNDEEHRLALESLKNIVEARFPGKKVATQIVRASTFYPAEEYHQDYYKKNPDDYHEYRTGCGRDRRLKELWGDQAGAAP